MADAAYRRPPESSQLYLIDDGGDADFLEQLWQLDSSAPRHIVTEAEEIAANERYTDQPSERFSDERFVLDADSVIPYE